MIQSSNSSIAQTIDSVHIVGQSLGAHSALMASVYASANKTDVKINSVIATCPVVDLNAAIQDIKTKSGLMGLITEGEFMNTLAETQKYTPSVKYILANPNLKFNERLEFLVRTYFLNLKSRLAKGALQLPQPLDQVRQITEKDFADMNNFANYLDRINVPTLLFGSKNDMVVSYKKNSSLVSQQNENQSVGVIGLDYGAHCAENMSYGWATIGNLIKGFILSHSSDIHLQSKFIEVQFTEKRNLLGTYQTIKWSADKKSDVLEGTLFSSLEETDCSAANCQLTSKVYVKIQDVFSGIEKPKSDEEAKRLARFANANLTLVDDAKESILASRKAPRYLKLQELQ